MVAPPPSSRDRVLAAIRHGLGRDALPEARLRSLRAGLTRPKARLLPAAATGTPVDLVERFVAKARGVAASVARVESAEAVPDAIAGYLEGEALPRTAVVAPDPRLDGVAAHPVLTTSRGTASGDTLVGISHAVAGIAETGTLVLPSGPDCPAMLNFLPDVHIVVVRAADIVGATEEALRTVARGGLPRLVNLVTGPSRTGDIEQTIQLGAHGPRRLHVVVVEDGDGGAPA